MPIDFENYTGLSNDQVNENRKEYGDNKLYAKERKSVFSYLKRISEEPMLLLLLAAAILYFIIGSNWDGGLMLAGVMVIIGIDFYQARKTDKALETLKELSSPKIRVIRNGKIFQIKSDDLVRGDYLIAYEGDRISGDGIIKADSNFTVDESALTGESGSLYKTKDADKKPKDSNMVFAGTLVLSGQAVIEVTAVGTSTQYGKIGESLADIQDKITPLQKQTGQIIKIFAIVGAISCTSLMAIVYYTNRDVIDSLLKGLTLAISVIPEEIPVVLTVFAALGAYRLTKKQTLIRKINTIETLGHITTLCTDKTGTLTENRMELQEVYANDTTFDARSIDISDKKVYEAITISLLASQPNPFDSMDASIHEMAKQIGIDTDEIYNQNHLVREYGFDHKIKFMGHAWRMRDKTCLAIKGSAEHVVCRSRLSKAQKAVLINKIDTMASKGLRVLAVAKKITSDKKNPTNLINIHDFEFTALLGFKDPPRADAKTAVNIARRAGIQIRMITGDHPKTALQIAEAVGIITNGKFITGVDLDKMSAEDLMTVVEKTHVFARINPEQKIKIISALQKRGEVVAMIGDGVNDAPSLKDADIGIAMGERGTNVAKEAADIILLDDRLLTVVNAISDGRRIFDNVQKAIGYIFIVHTYIILTALLIPIVGLPILLTPIHIILLELIIDPTCALVFEALPAEKDIMKRKPRSPFKAIVPSGQLIMVLLIGLMIFGITAIVYITALKQGFANEQARTIAFSLIVWTNLLLVLTSASKKQLFGNIASFLRNKAFLFVYSAVIIFLLVLIYTPGINTKFGFAVIPFWIIIGTAILGFLPLLFGELLKVCFFCQIKKSALGR